MSNHRQNGKGSKRHCRGEGVAACEVEETLGSRQKEKANESVDAEFYHNLSAETGGIYDLIEDLMPWLKGKEYIHTLLTINRFKLIKIISTVLTSFFI